MVGHHTLKHVQCKVDQIMDCIFLSSLRKDMISICFVLKKKFEYRKIV